MTITLSSTLVPSPNRPFQSPVVHHGQSRLARRGGQEQCWSSPASDSDRVEQVPRLSATQPTMPPWALIICSADSWNCGKYDPVQSARTRQSKPRSLASRAVVCTHTSVVTPVRTRCVTPRARRIVSRSVA